MDTVVPPACCGNMIPPRFQSLRIRYKNCNTPCALCTTLDGGWLSVGTLERVTGKCTSLIMAARPASLWTYALFFVPSKLEKSSVDILDLA